MFSVSENRSCRTTEISRARLSAKATPRADQPACSAATCSAVCVLSAAGTGAVQAIYIFITYNLCTTVVYTALNLPYGAMAPLMTNDEQDLAKINLFRMSMSPIGYLIVSAATLPIINRMGGDQAAWIKVTIIYSLVAIALLLWCFLGTKERVQMQAAEEAEKLPLSTRFGALLKNKYFLLTMCSTLCLAMYQTINGTCATYYAQYVLGNNEYFSALNMAETIPQIAVIMILAPFIKKFGKRNLYLQVRSLSLLHSWHCWQLRPIRPGRSPLRPCADLAKHRCSAAASP